MRLLSSLLLIVCVSLCAAQSPPAAPAPDPNQPGAVSGRVLNMLGGQSVPVYRATLHLYPEDGLAEHRYDAESDANGDFELTGVAPGRYRLAFEHAGFIPIAGPNRRATPLTISVSAGQRLSRIVFRVVQAAVIKGRISDDVGEPAARVTVQAVQEVYALGRRQLRVAGTSVTDDTGQYRIYNLAPGRYWLMARRVNIAEDMKVASTRAGARLYVTTFYPGAVDYDGAVSVDLSGGEEAPLNFPLVRAETVTVRGTVIVRGGSPPSEGSVIFSQLGALVSWPAADAQVQSGGRFTAHVVAGRYTVLANVATRRGDGSSGSAIGTAVVRVDDGSEIQIEAAASSTVTGYFRANARGVRDTSFRVVLTPALNTELEGVSGRVASATVDLGGRFTLPNVAPGVYEVGIAGRLCPDCYVASVRQGSRDLTGSLLHVTGEDRSSLDIEVRDDAARLSGVAFDNLGQPLRNGVVVAVPAAEMRQRGSLYQVSTTDQSGQFSMRGLPPGEYTVLAWDEVEYGSWLDPQYLKAVESRGTRVNLSGSDRKQVPVAAIMNLGSQPRAAQ